MIWKTALMCLAAAVTVSLATDADAKSKPRKRAAPVAAQSAPGFHSQTARMIEVKPGLLDFELRLPHRRRLRPLQFVRHHRQRRPLIASRHHELLARP